MSRRARFRVLSTPGAPVKRPTPPPAAARPPLHLVEGQPASSKGRGAHGRALPAGAARAVLAASGWLALAAQWAPVLGPVRPVLVFGFVLVAPGAAIAARLPLTTMVEKAMVSLALSVAIAIVVSEGFAFAHSWSPTAVLATLAVLASAAALVRRKPAAVAERGEWRPIYGPYPLNLPSRRVS